MYLTNMLSNIISLNVSINYNTSFLYVSFIIIYGVHTSPSEVLVYYTRDGIHCQGRNS